MPNMARSGFDIILTEGNLDDPEDGFLGFPKILGGMNLPIVSKYTQLFPLNMPSLITI